MCSLAAWLLVASALALQTTSAGPPVFGTKRYARGWAVSPYYGGVRMVAPYYAADYDLDYYYQDPSYPGAYSYYPSPSPYYRPYPYGYGYEDPLAVAEPVATDDEHLGMDYGMETWYDSHAPEADSNSRANAMFLQNLILANMYNDQNGGRKQYRPAHSYFPEGQEDPDDGTWVYGEPIHTANSLISVSKEDEDVRELKDLVNKKKARKAELFREQMEGAKMRPRKRQEEAAPDATPAGTPKTVNVRTPHDPSVYDTIKRLLQMQQRLQDNDDASERKSKPQKRSYIPSEESLVAQLGGLKKKAV